MKKIILVLVSLVLVSCTNLPGATPTEREYNKLVRDFNKMVDEPFKARELNNLDKRFKEFQKEIILKRMYDVENKRSYEKYYEETEYYIGVIKDLRD